jgi:uncharacterized protein YjbI with pentapeptide repeats
MTDETDRPNGTETMVEATGTEASRPATEPKSTGEASSAAAEPENTGTAFAKKAKDLEALRSAVIDAASVGAGLWLSYLFVLLYLAIAVGSVTHRNLLFESPVKLPFLNVDLPLLGFFVLGPAIFLIVHAYVLLHFVLLADKVGAFHAELQAQITDEDARTRLRRQLPSNIFVQFLAGPHEVRSGVMGFLLRLIAQISLVAGPLALLVFFQLQFLPYHNEAIAWWQRVAVVIDLVLLWMLWPSVARGEMTRLGWRDFRRRSVIACVFASLVTVLLVFTVATFPGEWLDATLLPMRFVPAKWPTPDSKALEWTSLHELLVQGEVDFVSGKTTSPFSNRLVLPGIDLTGSGSSGAEAGSAAVGGPISLRGRRLEGAVLIGARLKKADFTAARLQGADLRRADLREAKFECGGSKAGEPPCVQLEEAKLDGAQLQDASLSYAEMKDATLDGGQLQGASLDGAQLQGANLSDSKLQGTRLDGAQLQGAILDCANLEGASLKRADLQGASLSQTQLEGASLNDAELQGVAVSGLKAQGATLDGARLQGAVLEAAHLEGGSLGGAQLQSAFLDGARLQGASLAGAGLEGASLFGAQLQGATLSNAELQGARLDGAQLQGVSLFGTELQGATLQGVDLRGATLSVVFLWRADLGVMRGEGAQLVRGETGPKYIGLGCRDGPHNQQRVCVWSAVSYAALDGLIGERVPAGEKRNAALKRIAALDPARRRDNEDAMAKAWRDLAEASPAPAVHEKYLADALREAGCGSEGAPYVIHNLLQQLEVRFKSDSAQVAPLTATFLDEEHCPGAHGLSEGDKAKLRQISNRHPPTTPGSLPPTSKQ